MPWCEKCKCEYESNIEKCADCGELLVDHLEEKEKPVASYGEEYVFLINVANTFEADIMISKLELENIPTIKEMKSSGSYLNIASGFNFQGVDLMVPKEALDEARNIISVDSKPEKPEEIQVNKAFDIQTKEYAAKRKSVIRAFIFIVIAIPIIFSIVNFIKLF